MLTIHMPGGFTAERTYTLSVLLRERLGIDFKILVEEILTEYKFILPNGNVIQIDDHFWRRHRGSMPYGAAEAVPPYADHWAHPFDAGRFLTVIFGRPALEMTDTTVRCGLDLVASSFFMLARWEEYARPERDGHGRFPAAASLAARAGFLHRPVVDEYVELLARLLLRLGYPLPDRPGSGYRLAWSCDVDHPRLWWRWTDRLRTVAGSALRRGDWREAAAWLAGPVFRPGDPYDVFDEWMDLADNRGHVVQFNFIGERSAASDCYYPVDHPFVRQLAEKITRRGHVVGFHPSYEAFDDAAQFDRELASVRRLSTRPVTGGRHHYLRFAAPFTWRRWQSAGLAWDSTLGYADRAGFRCGTCHAFPVFDFLEGRPLPLREQPLIAMEVTPALYERKTPDETLAEWSALRGEVQRHGGQFTMLWHNSSWNTPFWKPWQRVLRAMLEVSG